MTMLFQHNCLTLVRLPLLTILVCLKHIIKIIIRPYIENTNIYLCVVTSNIYILIMLHIIHLSIIIGSNIGLFWSIIRL